jgi:AAA15 family ATPase/GTPase
MLDHLHIQNYRLFKELHLDGLRRVNLITGKNNTGKTAILEAIRIFLNSNRRLNGTINKILFHRNDLDEIDPETSLLSLFRWHILDSKIILNGISYSIKEDDEPYLEYVKEERAFKSIVGKKFLNGNESLIYLSATFEHLHLKLWDNIQLSPKKRIVIDILKLIDKNIWDFGVDSQGIPKVLVEDKSTAIPLRNFGEGTNRLFVIALAIASAVNTTLIIDEIDLGLHHSVQRKLWEIIFKFSKELNVQVFATTHSQDCVEAFTDVLNEKGNENEGQYIRLQRSRLDESIIEPIYYDAQKLKNSINFNLETR